MKKEDSKNTNQEYWRDQAITFAGLYDPKKPSLKSFVSRFLDSRTSTLISLIEPNEEADFLDLGCGSGVHMKLFAPYCRKIIGIDSSAPMLSEAEKILKSSDTHNWEVQLGDAQALPFPDKSFDQIISMGLLDYVPSPQQVLSECYRVLKDPGAIVFTIPKRPSLFSFLRSRFGNFIKRRVFNLPPIGNSVTRRELDILMRSLDLHCHYVKPIWTTMWIVKAMKMDANAPTA